MAAIQSVIHEGVKKQATLTLDTDTSGQTIELWAFDALYPDEEAVLLGTASGVPADTPITFTSLETDELSAPGAYYVEGWINPNTSGRQCVYPNADDTHELVVTDRRKVNV